MAHLNLSGKDAAVLQALPRIPVGISHWDMLTAGNYLVVDKTAKLKKLMSQRSVCFARPQGFGKSTLCSMLYELFAHGKESFAGKDIFELWSEENTYPVIRLQFDQMAGDNVSLFEQALKDAMVKAFTRAGFPEVASFDQNEVFSAFLGKFDVIAQQRKLVFLIEDWDDPLLNPRGREDNFKVVKSALRDFYAWLRDLPNYRFLLLTGSMPYRETSLFSGQDIQDLSMEPDFADLLGYTQEDINKAFVDYIPLTAKHLHITEAELFEQLKEHYGDFCFDHAAKIKVYYPYAINKFFSLVKSPTQVPCFSHYWLASANASATLTSYLRGHTLKAYELKQLCRQQLTLSYKEITDDFYFGTVDFKQLLVLAGYFSIKSIAKDTAAPEDREFHCGITNLAVRKAFVSVLTDYLLSFDEQKRSKLKEQSAAIQKDLLKGDIAHLCENLNLMLCKLDYRMLHDAEEPLIAFLCDVALSSGTELITTWREEENNLGLSYLVAETKNHLYVFALKHLLPTIAPEEEEERRALLDEADQQMISRGYGSTRLNKGKPITGVAVVIYDENHQIGAWRTITLAGADYLKREEGFLTPFSLETQLPLQPWLQWPLWPQVQHWQPEQQGELLRINVNSCTCWLYSPLGIDFCAPPSN